MINRQEVLKGLHYCIEQELEIICCGDCYGEGADERINEINQIEEYIKRNLK